MPNLPATNKLATRLEGAGEMTVRDSEHIVYRVGLADESLCCRLQKTAQRVTLRKRHGIGRFLR